MFVIGDIHGCYLGLKQCLERSGFDYDNDMLISLGDICDGWEHVYEVVEELLKIRYLCLIKGNHDSPFLEYMTTGIHPWKWSQGGYGTAKSYLRQIGKEDMITPTSPNGAYITPLNPGDIPESHRQFFNSQIAYFIDDQNRLFTHGGFNRHFSIKEQPGYIFEWDRDLWLSALSFNSMNRSIAKKAKFKIKDNFSEVFIGHTSTIQWGDLKPMKCANIWNLDQGAGWYGKLTIMNVDTHEYWQSDIVTQLYPDEIGRKRR